MKYILCLLTIGLTCSGAYAEAAPKIISNSFIEVIAARAEACGLIVPWQAASLRAMAHGDREMWTSEERLAGRTQTSEQSAATGCDDAAMQVWLEGAYPGFDREMLPPYLVAYRHLAKMDPPPRVFSFTALRSDYGPAIIAIDSKLSALEQAGVQPEGGKGWPAYVERTQAFVDEFVGALSDPESAGDKVDQSAAWIAQSALITELWLREHE